MRRRWLGWKKMLRLNLNFNNCFFFSCNFYFHLFSCVQLFYFDFYISITFLSLFCYFIVLFISIVFFLPTRLLHCFLSRLPHTSGFVARVVAKVGLVVWVFYYIVALASNSIPWFANGLIWFFSLIICFA